MRKILISFGCFLFFGILQAQDYRFGKVSAKEISQKEHSIDPTAEAAVLYRESKTEFQHDRDRGWFLATDYFERIKIYTRDGFDYGNKTITLYKGIKQRDELKKLRAYTYNLDEKGKVDRIQLENNGIFKEDVNDYLDQTKLTMPNVQEGSVIEIRYTIESPFIMNVDLYQFQELIPVDKVHLDFSAPEDFRFQPYHRGRLPINVKTTTADKSINIMVTQEVPTDGNTMGFPRKVTKPKKITFKNVVYTVDMENVPAIEEEPYVGNLENFMAGIQFELRSAETESGIQGYSVTWSDVSKSIYQSTSFGTELRRNNYFKKDIDALLKGVSQPQKKIQLIYEYVQQKMNWNGMAGVFTRDGVRTAYKEETGNAAEINLMLTSMLNYASLDASPVLVSTKDHGIPLFPTINGFNYVIAAVELPEGIFLLDATNKNAEMGVLGSSIMNGQGRLVRQDDISDWISLHPQQPAISQTLLSVKLDENLELKGQTQQRVTGNYALNYRNTFKGLAPSEWKTKLEKRYGQVDLSEIVLENLQNPKESVILQFDFASTHGIQQAGDKVFISPLHFLQTGENPFKSETRNYPIDFGYPHRSQIMVNLTLPTGYQLESVPESALSTLGNMGTYKYLVTQNGNTVQLSVELSIQQPVIAESNYSDLKEFFEAMIEKEAEMIVLKKV